MLISVICLPLQKFIGILYFLASGHFTTSLVSFRGKKYVLSFYARNATIIPQHRFLIEAPSVTSLFNFMLCGITACSIYNIELVKDFIPSCTQHFLLQSEKGNQWSAVGQPMKDSHNSHAAQIFQMNKQKILSLCNGRFSR